MLRAREASCVKESKAMADWDKGAYRQVRENWENAMHLAGDDRYKRALALGLHILRRYSPNALELAAANADDRHSDFIVKLRMTLHLQQSI
jgi:hypothetical protein